MLRTFRKSLSGAIALSLLASLGCGKGGPEPVKRVKVSGHLKVDGKDLPTGRIIFDAQNGQPSGSMDILDGHYEGLAPVGKCKVTISSFVKKSMKEKMKMDGPGYDATTEENLLPPRYNSASEIVREVQETGTNTFDFLELKSK